MFIDILKITFVNIFCRLKMELFVSLGIVKSAFLSKVFIQINLLQIVRVP